jgi:hypothetical protein
VSPATRRAWSPRRSDAALSSDAELDDALSSAELDEALGEIEDYLRARAADADFTLADYGAGAEDALAADDIARLLRPPVVAEGAGTEIALDPAPVMTAFVRGHAALARATHLRAAHRRALAQGLVDGDRAIRKAIVALGRRLDDAVQAGPPRGCTGRARPGPSRTNSTRMRPAAGRLRRALGSVACRPLPFLRSSVAARARGRQDGDAAERSTVPGAARGIYAGRDVVGGAIRCPGGSPCTLFTSAACTPED